MAEFTLTDAYVQIGACNHSDHVVEVTINQGTETQDKTAMGDSYRQFLAGLKTWSMDITFNQDFAAGDVHAQLQPLVGTTSCIEVRATSGAVAVTNPSFEGITILTDYNPLAGAVGDVVQIETTWEGAGDLLVQTA